MRQSLAALKEELAQLKKRKSADSKSMKKTNEKARASTKSLIDGMAADVKKTIEDMEARNAATLAELKKVQAEVVELRKSAASPATSSDAGSANALIEGNSDIIKGWIKRIIQQQKRQLVSKGISSGTITREMVDGWIQEQMLTFAADRTGKVDYAIQSSGARIVHALTSSTYLNPNTTLVRKLARSAGLAIHHGPEQVLKPSSEIGRYVCFV